MNGGREPYDFRTAAFEANVRRLLSALVAKSSDVTILHDAAGHSEMTFDSTSRAAAGASHVITLHHARDCFLKSRHQAWLTE